MANREEPGYYAVIPATVRYDKSIPPGAKLLYGEISALCNKKGYCWASNEYFAELYEISERNVIKWIKSLTASGHIAVYFSYFPNSKKKARRFISISKRKDKQKSVVNESSPPIFSRNDGFDENSGNSIPNLPAFCETQEDQPSGVPPIFWTVN